MSTEETPLTGGRITVGVVRVGDTVRRPITRDRTHVHDLLLHLEERGFDAVPGLRLWDLGYFAFAWLNLGDDDYTGEEQIRRLEVVAQAYGTAGCAATQIAIHALARQTALAAAGRVQGKMDMAEWASAAADWTLLNVLEQLSPTGYALPSG